MSGVIALHVGAGYHSENLRPNYKKTCKNACLAAVKTLKAGGNAVEAVAEAVSVLENCVLTNAGIGSNLTLNGIVECDAGIMDGKTLNFGSVGALRNIKNPIKVAHKILDEQTKGLLHGGRIPPCMIVGQGAQDWALDHGFNFFDNQFLSTKSSETAYMKNLYLLKNSSFSGENGTITLDDNNEKCHEENTMLDTVGAVCLDLNGNVASAVSSGGLLLKHSGRIGQAAIIGSGCWAENSTDSKKPNIACCTTGVGEYLIKTSFAKECSKTVYKNPGSITVIPDFFKDKFIDNPCLQKVISKPAGVLLLKYFVQDSHCELSWFHNTRTMMLGFMSTVNDKPCCILSSQPVGGTGNSIVGSERSIKI